MRSQNLPSRLAIAIAVSWVALEALPARAQTDSIVREIRIEGAERIDPTTVRSYMAINPGDPLDVTRVNQSLKALYATGLFSDVQIRRDGLALVVQVSENPVINRIAFEGNRRIEEKELDPEISLRPRVVFTKSKVQSDVRRILDVYRRQGFYSANVEPKLIKLDQNRVDLVFEIDEGAKTGVRRIIFVGNDKFSDGRLREVIFTERSRWWAILGQQDTYDPDRLVADREQLRKFYLENGYADFRVNSAVAELTPDREDFFITFSLFEGNRYKFGKTKITSGIRQIDTAKLLEVVKYAEGDWYNGKKVEDATSAISDAVGTLGYAFADVRPRFERDEATRVVNLTFEIGEGPKVFVERIEIRGNFRTEDRVIRREFRLAEGDAFNTAKFKRSRQRVQNLGFFQKVDMRTANGSSPERTVIEVDVTEKPTGELSFGVGFSTSEGILGDVSIRERNLLGRGQDLKLAFQGSTNTQKIDLGFTEPYFLDRPVSAGFDVFRTSTDRQDTSSYDETDLGFRLRSGFALSEYLTQGIRYELKQVTIENVQEGASRAIADQAGDTVTSSVGQTLFYDRRDSRLQPTSGYFARLSNDVAGLGGDVRYMRTRVDSGIYWSLTDSVVLGLSGEAGYINGFGEDVRITDRFALGGSKVRGFKNSGIGPRDTGSSLNESLGGNIYYATSAELRFPLGLPDNLGVTGRAFADAGSLWDAAESGPGIVDDANALRVGVGFGINWNSPFGPVAIDYGFPIVKKDYDRTEGFRVNFGTNF